MARSLPSVASQRRTDDCDRPARSASMAADTGWSNHSKRKAQQTGALDRADRIIDFDMVSGGFWFCWRLGATRRVASGVRHTDQTRRFPGPEAVAFDPRFCGFSPVGPETVRAPVKVARSSQIDLSGPHPFCPSTGDVGGSVEFLCVLPDFDVESAVVVHLRGDVAHVDNQGIQLVRQCRTRRGRATAMSGLLLRVFRGFFGAHVGVCSLTLIWLKICQVDIVVFSNHFPDGRFVWTTE